MMKSRGFSHTLLITYKNIMVRELLITIKAINVIEAYLKILIMVLALSSEKLFDTVEKLWRLAKT